MFFFIKNKPEKEPIGREDPTRNELLYTYYHIQLHEQKSFFLGGDLFSLDPSSRKRK